MPFLNEKDLTLSPDKNFSIYYQPVTFSSKSHNKIIIKNIVLKSRILYKMCEHKQQIYPFFISLKNCSDSAFIPKFEEKLTKFIKNRFNHNIVLLKPGVVIDWLPKEIINLFDFLGNSTEKAGISIDKNIRLHPLNSIIGIGVPTDKEISNCSFCNQSKCSRRISKFKQDLVDKFYEA